MPFTESIGKSKTAKRRKSEVCFESVSKLASRMIDVKSNFAAVKLQLPASITVYTSKLVRL